ncbi:hypothetical protein F5883DRAFT_516660 [Diaporthe sp. PMI_573]|nr:hypothetical protein F5883DRAFT_516660 [Diaporthaceae sp. PMI_573]
MRLLCDWAGAGIVGLPFAYTSACKRECVREAGPQGPPPKAPAQRLAWSGNATLLRLRLREGAPSTPSTLHSASLPTLPLSSSPPAVWQTGSLAALVPDPCVARSLVSNLRRAFQTSPPSAAPSFPCPPGGSTRLHAGSKGIYLHRQRLATDQGEALA